MQSNRFNFGMNSNHHFSFLSPVWCFYAAQSINIRLTFATHLAYSTCCCVLRACANWSQHWLSLSLFNKFLFIINCKDSYKWQINFNENYLLIYIFVHTAINDHLTRMVKESWHNTKQNKKKKQFLLVQYDCRLILIK